jgi:hypothetical protein
MIAARWSGDLNLVFASFFVTKAEKAAETVDDPTGRPEGCHASVDILREGESDERERVSNGLSFILGVKVTTV